MRFPPIWLLMNFSFLRPSLGIFLAAIKRFENPARQNEAQVKQLSLIREMGFLSKGSWRTLATAEKATKASAGSLALLVQQMLQPEQVDAKRCLQTDCRSEA